MSDFVRFTFSKIYTEINAKGIEKKKASNLPKWKEINRDNFRDYIKPKHTAHAVITGEMSNITVIDFDTKEVYRDVVAKYPSLTEHYTVETYRGFHIYFEYNREVNTTTNGFSCFPHIDVRNDNSIVYAPPTKYTLQDGNEVGYEYIGGRILAVPEDFLTEFKQFAPIVPIIEKKKESIIAIPTITIKTNKKEDMRYATLIIESGILNDMAEDHDNWRGVGFCLKSVFGKDDDATGMRLFKAFSSVSIKYNEMDVEEYWKRNLNHITSKKPLTIGSLKKWAKTYDAFKYKLIQNEVSPTLTKQEITKRKREEYIAEKKKREDDGEIHILPDNRKIPYHPELEAGVNTDYEAGLKFYKLYPYCVFCNSELYLFNYETGIWTTDKVVIRKIILKFEKYLYKVNEITGDIQRDGYGNTIKLVNTMIQVLETVNIDNDWCKRTELSSKGKILFHNGYYDFNEQKFYDKETYGFNPDIVFFGKIYQNLEMVGDEDMEYMESIKQRLFYNTLGTEVGDYLILNFARALSGECMKRFLMCIGLTDCGKGIITKAIQLACGDYAGSFNAECFSNKRTGLEESQKLRWVLNQRHLRINLSNELSMGTSKDPLQLDGNLIKKVASGGDVLVGRFHGGVETSFVPMFLMCMFANDMPKIVPYDEAMQNRACIIEFEKHYVEAPATSFELLKDDHLKDEIATERFQKCLIMILIQSYHIFVENNKREVRPEKTKKSTDEWGGKDLNNPIDLFMQKYEITQKRDDCIFAKNIMKWFDSLELGVSYLKFIKDVNRYLQSHGYSNVEAGMKKIKGKGIAVWFGIKQRAMEIDENDDPVDEKFAT